MNASVQAEAQTENKLFRLKVKEERVSRVARISLLVDAFIEAAFWGTEFSCKCFLLQSARDFNGPPPSR